MRSRAPPPPPRPDVFYEVFVRSVADSDGDGVGDLAGLTARLDYLNDGDSTTTTDLGVDGIWLMPVFESPSCHGYDTLDCRRIDAEYGHLAAFQRLIAEAHRRRIRVIVASRCAGVLRGRAARQAVGDSRRRELDRDGGERPVFRPG
jgi:1,4-alpha-glucan branching enzyme